ncbi:hypothetical protein L3Q82_010898 [Scortum barcoo]|uniref:Uncharacterized protein n=1 Tax=Scortum barcoo TaxID=214431 RepID=A0ACB8W8F4_9TELE|nr:hypothetical protein L3Q82_010898 [Scortum barcoo]
MRAERFLKQTRLQAAGTRKNISGHNRGSKMKHVTGLFLVVLTFQMGRADEAEPGSGYCIGTQCVTVVHDRSDFTDARDQCSEQGGHLMTVRSTVSQDMFSILLGNLTGRFWIGLHRRSGCPDSAAKLKGYQWVTKDSESDFSNWAPSFDSSCSSRRCVSVSPESDFKWTQESCSELAAGFLCEYTFSDPCKSLTLAQGESATYWTPMGFGGEDMLSLPPGSTAIRMPAKIKYICFSEQWVQAPWSCEIQRGGCEHGCTVDHKNEPACYCPLGQTVNPTNKVTCEVAAQDPCRSLRCAQACYRSGDSYACTCEHGFELAQDGRSCVEINNCSDQRQCPMENFRCINTVGSFQCVCKDGYRLVGTQCKDVDECVSAPCEHICTNTRGSYTCSCYDGYKEDPKVPNKCKLHCGQEECLAECDPNDRSQCYCPDGYVAEERGDETFCMDINECVSGYCDQGCRNTFGGYVCSCDPGYTLVGEFACVKNEDGDADGGSESSGAATTPSGITTAPLPYPDSTRQPSAVTVGGLVGIIVCTAFFIVLVVFLAHHILSNRGKMESSGALKAAEDEARLGNCAIAVLSEALGGLTHRKSETERDKHTVCPLLTARTQVSTCYPSCTLYGLIATCARQNHYWVPALPSNITHLYLEMNYISEINITSLTAYDQLEELDLGQQKTPLVIRNNAFLRQRRLTRSLSSVIEIDLSSNALTYLKPDVFPASLKILYLSNNFLASPDPMFFQSLSFFSLAENRFHCNCDLESFLKWLNNTNVPSLSPVDEYRCEFPAALHNLPLLNYSRIIEPCEKDDEKAVQHFKFAFFIFSALLIISVIFSCVVYTHLRGHIFIIYKKISRRVLEGPKPIPPGDEVQYDAFFCFSDRDYQWVEAALLKKLDNQFSEENIFHCCFEARDFLAGEDHLSNICDAIWSSRKTVCIISKEFLKDGWCLEAFTLVQGRMLEELTDTLIMLVVGKVAHYELMKYKAVRAFVQKREYLTWPEDPQDLEWFYERLSSQILKDTKVKRAAEDKPESAQNESDAIELKNIRAIAT